MKNTKKKKKKTLNVYIDFFGIETGMDTLIIYIFNLFNFKGIICNFCL
jgi:hypothetical protein